MKDKMTRTALERELKTAGSPEGAAGMARYFKTGEGQYGEGDVFLGVTVPVLRRIALRYRTLDLDDLQRLLEAEVHEYRAAALEILVAQYKGGDEGLREVIVDFYLRNTQHVNNWDLVDGSCREILGEHLKTRSRRVLANLARSKSLWERRIAMVSTMTLVWAGEVDDALRTAEVLLDDRHDLIHKAVGWVLREVGDLDETALLSFLKKHYDRLPRTALRYAIEHFPVEERKKMLAGSFRT
jgi:3-methyladenine DNA glycosylase AlkD